MNEQDTPLFEQKLFRTIVVGGTGLTLAVMLGSLALIKGHDQSGFQWGWSSWSILLFAGAILFNRSFWSAVFRAGTNPSPANKAKVVYHVFGLIVLGVGAFLYPIRFLGHENYIAIARGLFTAVTFLGGVVVLLYKVGQGLFARELKDGQAF